VPVTGLNRLNRNRGVASQIKSRGVRLSFSPSTIVLQTWTVLLSPLQTRPTVIPLQTVPARPSLQTSLLRTTPPGRSRAPPLCPRSSTRTSMRTTSLSRNSPWPPVNSPEVSIPQGAPAPFSLIKQFPILPQSNRSRHLWPPRVRRVHFHKRC
jgi:hypothetical protein